MQRDVQLVDVETSVVATGVTPERLRNLYLWNMGLTILHFGEAIAMWFLTNDFALPVILSFPKGPPGTTLITTSTAFTVRIGWMIAGFLALAALDHFLTATIARGTYERDLRRGMNRFRWIEYSVSSTIMVVVICMYWGVIQLVALIPIAGANVAMILFGWLQEKLNPPGRKTTTMLPFWCGALVGLTPWVAQFMNVGALDNVDNVEALWAIIIVQGIFFFCFGLNQWLQYRQVGWWTNYVFGEKTYLVLSLGAKSVLAWQIFAVSLVAKVL